METNNPESSPSTGSSGGNSQQALTIEDLQRQLAREKERADYAWQNTHIADKARAAAEERERIAIASFNEERERALREGKRVLDLQRIHEEHLDDVMKIWAMLEAHGFPAQNHGWIGGIEKALKHGTAANDVIKTARDLVHLVEGPGWTDFRAHGTRLKDFKQWCAFYVAVVGLKRES